MTRHSALSLVCCALMLATAACATAQVDSGLLSTERWRELSQGVSLRPPADAALRRNTDDGALLRIDSPGGPGGYVMRVFIKQSKVRLAAADRDEDKNPQLFRGVRKPIDNIIDIAQKEMAMAHRSIPISTVMRVIGGKDGAISYFRLKDDKRGDWIVGQVYVVLDDRTFALIQMDVDEAHYPTAKRAFDAMINSIEVESAEVLRERRNEWSRRALAWHATIKPERLHEAIQPEQLFRITFQKQTIGWMRITQEVTKGWESEVADPNAEKPANNDPRRRARAPRRVESPGVGVIVQARLYVPGATIQRYHVKDLDEKHRIVEAANQAAFVMDMDGRYFVSDDREQELWSNRIALRPLTVKTGAPGAKPQVGTEADVIQAAWADTGIRDGDAITVSLETPNGVKYYEWPKPPVEVTVNEVQADGRIVEHTQPGYLYLSQVEMWMLPQLLPHDQEDTFGFYTYRGPNVTWIPGIHVHAANVAGAMSFGLVDFKSASDGMFSIKERPTLLSAEYLGVYDAAGRLQQRQLPDGLEIVQATRDELAALRTRFK